MDLDQIFRELAAERQLFHSEADLQHAFAWKIRSTLGCQIRLERRLPGTREYSDIAFENAGTRILIELKYKTMPVVFDTGDEPYDLKNHGAQDLGRYDFWKDVHRLEKALKRGLADRCWTILLTNDQSYWKTPSRAGTIDAAFRLFDGRSVSGVLRWTGKPAEGTVKNREQSIPLAGRYTILWKEFSSLPITTCGRFRYLLVEAASSRRDEAAFARPYVLDRRAC